MLDVFEAEGVRYGLEVHPTEIAYDFVTTRRTLDAVRRQSFGINLDPSHFAHQFLDPAEFAREFGDRIYHVHVKDSKRRLDGRRSILSSHLQFGDRDRGWDFVSPGHGDVDFDELLRALNKVGYTGPLSVEWEDSGMDREFGAAAAVGFVRRVDFVPSEARVRRRDASERGLSRGDRPAGARSVVVASSPMASGARASVVCAGVVVADVFVPPLPRLPEPGELVATEDFVVETGGCAANAGIALARLGVRPTVVAKVGDDLFGDFVERELSAAGVDVSGIGRAAGLGTSKTVIVPVTGEDRRYIHTFGANAALGAADIASAILTPPDVLYVGGFLVLPALRQDELAEQLRRARQSGTRVVLDVVRRRAGRCRPTTLPVSSLRSTSSCRTATRQRH